jgi:deoxyribonuclease-4
VGKGEIGETGCALFLSEPRFEGLPLVLETPGSDRKGPSAADLAYVNDLRERGRAARDGGGAKPPPA